tara:strand:- start:3072 stop:3734 length:663 start_codon:yes stop_codon:yes gene_type:complete
LFKKILKSIKKIIASEIDRSEATKKNERVNSKDAEDVIDSITDLDLRIIGLFSDVEQEKTAELAQQLIYLNEINKAEENEDERHHIDFYISTYGGCADDMFALYDLMNIVKENTVIKTIGLGKVMSAGVLLLAAGTKGERRISKNCRVMIHNVVGGTAGSLPNLTNELEAIQQLQDDFTSALVENTKLTKKNLKKILNEKVNVYLSAEEAVEYGIADIII